MVIKNKYPNQLFRLGLLTAEDILGKKGLNAILNYANLQKFIDNYTPDDMELEHTSDDFVHFVTGLIDVLGERGVRSLLFRVGIRTFEISYELFPALFNIDGIEPEEKNPERMFDEFKRIYQIIVDASISIYGNIYKFYDCEEGVALEMSPCFWCQGIKTKEPICFAQIGYQFAVARWITGQNLKIEETHCSATGDDKCRFVIHRPK